MAAYDPDRDFYQLLGLDHLTASSKTIVRQAYLKSGTALPLPDSRWIKLTVTTARKAHPDRDRANDAATENFQKIQEAYETLSDPSKKTMYDRVMVEWSRQEKMKYVSGGQPCREAI